MRNLFLAAIITLLAFGLSGCNLDQLVPSPVHIVHYLPSATMMTTRIIENEGGNAIWPSNTPIQPKQVAAAPIKVPSATPWPTATRTPPPPLPTPTWTPSPIPPSVTPTITRTPIVADQVTACRGAPPISNKPETWAQVSLDPPVSNRVRLGPGLGEETTGHLEAGEVVWIEAGPRCADSFTWWYVRSLSGLEGWTAEGDTGRYWLVQPLNAFLYDTTKPRSVASVILQKGKKYRVIMSGTYSLWIVEQWTDPGVCIRGDAGTLPMFPSPGKKNGPAGLDPFYWYARPFYGPCQPANDPSETVSKIQFSLDAGLTYWIPSPIVPEYRPDHTYTYEVTGQGKSLIVRLDDVPLEDNYGQILVIVEAIEE